jgi:hypothetical protein
MQEKADLEMDTASTSDGDSVAGTLDGTCSETASVEEESLADGDDTFWDVDACMPTTACSSSTSDGAAKEDLAAASQSDITSDDSSECDLTSRGPGRMCWRSRVLRVLGIQRLWSGHGATASSETSEVQENRLQKGENTQVEDSSPAEATRTAEENDEEEEEEHILSSKLVAAVRNAEIHAANARAEQARVNCNGCPLRDIPVTQRAGTNKVKFARKSEVSFFSFDLDHTSLLAPTLLEYRRPLETKVFDGPSGHKARRITSSDSKSAALRDEDEASTRPSALYNCSEDECSPEEEAEDWEDQCDDIAELMGQQRSCMLWSASW